MSESDHTPKRKTESPRSAAPAKVKNQAISSAESGTPAMTGFRGFVHRRPIGCFIGGVVLLMLLFYAFYMPEWKWRPLTLSLDWNLAKHARLTSAVLNILGEQATVSGRVVYTSRFAMEIVRGCDALEPLALFLSAVIAFPVALRFKLVGAALGILAMEITNLIRLVTLYYVGVHWPKRFEMMHVEVWQATFIVLSVAYWAGWALWATRKRTKATFSTPTAQSASR